MTPKIRIYLAVRRLIRIFGAIAILSLLVQHPLPLGDGWLALAFAWLIAEAPSAIGLEIPGKHLI